ncbi:hypothetical protein O3P69_004025 [Scylla paramamosain]|uniref:Uncharacterized protein n=1 Tax=Scylla paramamosain TaxID=85552 RepID=A0AAW0UIS6_SCYPA
MELQDGRHDRAEDGLSEVKLGQMDLIAAMLASMRQEMAVDRETQAQRAREQAERTDQLAHEQAENTDQLAREQAERTDQLACEQAERTDQLAREQAQRVDNQVRHLEDVPQSSLASLKAETQQYTDQACDSVVNELLDKVQTLEGEVQGLREEVRMEKQRHELATAHLEEQAAPRVLPGTTGVVDLLGPAWGLWQESSARGPCSVVSELVAASGGSGAIGTPPFCCHHPLCLPPLAAPPAATPQSFGFPVFGETQASGAEVYRTHLKKRTQEQGEKLSQLAQDMEALLKGPVDVRSSVGSAVERLPVYIADLDEPCLLGLNYLTQSKACVDLGQKLSAEVAAVRPLPDFLEDLAHRSAANLTEAQTEEVRHTLAQWMNKVALSRVGSDAWVVLVP